MALLRRNPDMTVTTLEDGTFVVDPSTQAIFYLDTLAGGVWTALAEPMSAADLEALLLDAFPDRPRDTIIADLTALLRSMTERGLLLTSSD
ncbi:MAG: PqqD family protein [Alphaproteobacteria bacterium]|nr:PqqD family protein [Alphaproteobacteria bacterium]